MDSNQQKPTGTQQSSATGIKKPSGIPSATGISRLQQPTTVKKTGIPQTGSSSSLTTPSSQSARATTPTNLPSGVLASNQARATTPTNLASGTPASQQPTPLSNEIQSKPTIPTSTNRQSLSMPKDQTAPSISSESAPVLSKRESISIDQDKETAQLRSTVKDLTEKLETLKLKRAEDRDKLREFDKLKLQHQQMIEFKEKAQEKMSELNKELQAAKQEAKTLKDEYEAYKEEMANHEERIEHMTVEKELAEETSEQYKYEITQLKDRCEELSLELDVLKGEIEENGVQGAAASFQAKQQDKEKERLSAALLKLRDMSHQDKSEINNLRKQVEEASSKLAQLSKENEKLKTENQAKLLQINELNDQVTATLGSVQMIEQLTEQNLDLETKIVKLEETIADLEEMNEVNDQILEGIREEEREVRQNLDMAESRIRESEREIESLKYKIADYEKTIKKFRDLVQQQQTEKETLNTKSQNRIDELQAKIVQLTANGGATASPGNFDFKQKLVESKNFAKLVENELNKIEIQNLKRYTNYLLSFMSDQFLKRSGDHECILTLLFFKRLTNKSDLILNQVKEKYAHLLEKIDVKSHSGDQPEFVYEISMILMHLKLLCNKYDFILNTCNSKTFLNIGSMYFDFNSHEKVVDLMTELLQKDQLDENRKNLEMAEKMCVHLQTIYKNHLSEEKFDDLTFLEDLVRFGAFGCDSITVYLQNINSIVHAKDDQTEIMQLLRELSCHNEELKIFLKKALKRLPKEDNSSEKKIILNIPVELRQSLENCINNFYMVCKTLKELNNLASNSYSFITANDTIETTLTAKKLEDLAYQACDKVYLIDDNGPYENLRNSINELHETFLKTLAGLDTGEYEKVLTDEEYKIRKYMVNSPILAAAEQFKNALIEAESIKFKLETKEEEIKEIKRNLKTKVDELSEYKLRISINENKSENALKEAEEKNKKLSQSIDELKASFIKKEEEHIKTIDAMQQEIDTHENEIRELKKKIPKKSGPETSGSIMTQKPNMALSDSPFLLQEIKVAKTLNKMLEKNNNELKKQLTENMLNNLIPLPKVKSITASSNNSNNKVETINKLSKQSNDLMKEIYESLANVKVHEIKPGKPIKSSDEIKQTQKEKLHYTLITQTANQIQKKLGELQAELSNTKRPTSQTVKEAQGKYEKKCVGEIILPCDATKGKVVDLSVTYDELKELLKHI